MMAPSGSGKGTLTRHVQGTFPELVHTVSCTTREARPHEVDGVQYYFLSREVFEHKIAQGDFIEWAEYSGNLYGTLHAELTNRLVRGDIVLCEIEIQGVLQLIQRIPKEHRTIIYIDAGDSNTLKARALKRAPMSEEEIKLRYCRYQEEVAHKDIADYIVYNHEGCLEKAKQDMEEIVEKIITQVTHAKNK